jgi:hypothetical protein
VLKNISILVGGLILGGLCVALWMHFHSAKQTMKVEPDSFEGKIYLLVIDKVIIGAIIALAFVAYDRFRTNETQKLQASAATIQLTFERARLAKEFLPFIMNRKEDVIARGYTLREAARTGSIDAEAAVEIGRQLLADGLPDDHFRRVMAVIIPDGIPAIARRGIELSASWRTVSDTSFDPTTTFDPVSGVENIPKELMPFIHEGRLWRTVLIDGFSGVSPHNCDTFQDSTKLTPLLYGLFVLMHPGNQPEAVELSRSPCRAVGFVGHLSRVLFSGRDEEAVRYVSTEIGRDHTSLENIQLARVTLSILSEFGLPIVGGVRSGPPAGPIAISIARILVEQRSQRENQPGVPEAHYWLQWQAADTLDLMAQAAKRVHFESNPNGGARPAESVLISFLSQFSTELQQAKDDNEIESLSTKYEGGKLIRRVVAVLALFDSQQAQTALSKLLSVGSAKLRHFPFLEEDLKNSLHK